MRIQRVVDAEVRALDDGKMILEGYALKFNSKTVIGNRFEEMISKDAFKDCDMKDVVFLFNHDMNKLMAGTRNGSLTLQVDDIGLKFQSELIDTSSNEDIYKMARSGLLKKMSFGFSLFEKGAEFIPSDPLPLRILKRIKKLYDISIVTFPAYENTEVFARSWQEECKELDDEMKRYEQDKRLEVILNGK